MDAEIAKYKKEYPNLDVMMIETILKMTEEQHRKFQEVHVACSRIGRPRRAA